MARSTADDEFTENIIDVDVSSEMENSYLEYAYSVIYSRALPDARDGLKPVQRRILYTMGDMGVRPDRPHVKSARVVGQVMGQLHPHGDSAIYDALVRMAQPWAMRLPLIDGHGNFGALDAGPAAMRYTECRMAPAASAMIAGLDEDTVDFVPNYDGKETEPGVLPAAFPNLLVNGASGIAVGMATNMPPHNLVEVVAALRHMLDHPDADLDAIMRFIPGPDLPTGGRIIGLDGIRDAYRTGRGTFRIRATSTIERVSPRRQGIVVTALPYMVGPEKIIDQLKTLVQSKKITGIADVKDLTDLANGTRLVIEIKNGINAEAMLQRLYRLTKLEDTFGINNVALVEGQPRTLGLMELLQVYLDHRLDVTLRRTRFQLRKATDRLHLVEGLLTAILDIDDVIAIIRSSEDVGEARTRLMDAFDLDEVQTNYILDMQLRRLTKLSRIELESERDDLRAEIDRLTRIVTDDRRLRKVVSQELAEIAKSYGTPRRTVLLGSSGATEAAAGPLEVPDDPTWVLLSATGRIARIDTADGLPSTGPRAKHDVIVSSARTTARGDFGVLTSTGRLIRARAIDLVDLPATANAPSLTGGTPVAELVQLEKGEQVIAVTGLSGQGPALALGTRDGVVKRVNPEITGQDWWEVIALKGDDRVVGAAELDPDSPEDTQLCFITESASLLHFSASLVRPQGRKGSGVAGIRSASPVIFFGAVPAADAVVVTGADDTGGSTGSASVKVTDLSRFPAKGRATGGVRCHRFLRTETRLLLAWAGRRPAVACGATGKPVELPDANDRRDGSGDQLASPITAVASRVTAAQPRPEDSSPSSPDPVDSRPGLADQPELFGDN
ncbi:DNA topoisomerase IV subunit A [Acidipropionibacterium acidipropionici]|uniref:DNA topoisomerase (ATP-hydrolyzing) n=1 Tax=Acidipropionibacterium acidipropionici TaxID=1748 RepID=A0AAC9AMV7_9ACTN|nr:DNA topoisomerase IV subunit A [Acidipropionibacterium acidipropionici]AMS04602.1 DNA topoisomerase IV [Acidipropionibacterium acidipropionici]AOZ46092.1 DNA topoisomerase IV [Acidipropionibacterium acidipropionici]AZP37882.1 DNA topoisomerase IV subunit A [Acidipropionibacterium acidipropionici]